MRSRNAQGQLCFCNSYLVKKLFHVTGCQTQFGHISWVCLVKIVVPLVVVFDCYIPVCDFEVVGQLQDVSADETQ